MDLIGLGSSFLWFRRIAFLFRSSSTVPFDMDGAESGAEFFGSAGVPVVHDGV